MSAVLEEAGLAQGTDELDFALRDSVGRVFFGPETTFDNDPVVSLVQLSGETWELAGAPPEGWQAATRNPWYIYQIGGLIIVGLVTGLVHLSIDRQARLTQRVRCGFRRGDSLSDRAPGTAELSSDLSDALLLDEVRSPNLLSFLHTDHLPLRYLSGTCFSDDSRVEFRWVPFRLACGSLFDCHGAGDLSQVVPFSISMWVPFQLTKTPTTLPATR